MADGTLTALFPAHLFRVGGERLSVRPVVLRELPLVQVVMEGWAGMVVSAGEYVPKDAWEFFLMLLAGACGKDLAWVKGLDESDFEALAAYVLALNKDVWDPPPGQAAGDDVLTWAAITQRLIEHGHPWESIQQMTLSQVRTFLEESLGLERDQLARDITAASFSMADGKSVQKATRELRRG